MHFCVVERGISFSDDQNCCKPCCSCNAICAAESWVSLKVITIERSLGWVNAALEALIRLQDKLSAVLQSRMVYDMGIDSLGMHSCVTNWAELSTPISF